MSPNIDKCPLRVGQNHASPESICGLLRCLIITGVPESQVSPRFSKVHGCIYFFVTVSCGFLHLVWSVSTYPMTQCLSPWKCIDILHPQWVLMVKELSLCFYKYLRRILRGHINRDVWRGNALYLSKDSLPRSPNYKWENGDSGRRGNLHTVAFKNNKKKKAGLKPSSIGSQSTAIATNLTLWLQRDDIGNMAIFFRSFHSLKEKQFWKIYWILKNNKPRQQ